MRSILYLSLLLSIFSLQALSAQTLSSTMHFASLKQAQQLLAQEDQFTQAWSSFDIQSRLGTSQATRTELLALIPEQARAFTAEEKKKLRRAAEYIDQLCKEKGWTLPFHDTVYLVKTTGKEEVDAAGYTRGNYIVLNQNQLGGVFDGVAGLLAHEAFHVLSRQNPAWRARLYATIGFQMMTPIAYPEAIAPLRITNPDAPQTDTYIQLQIDQMRFDCMMVLYAERPYQGGKFFDYLQIGFLALNEEKQALIKNGKPIIYSIQDAAPSFFAQVGRNTEYIIHPEEILAENFRLALFSELEAENRILQKISPILGS